MKKIYLSIFILVILFQIKLCGQSNYIEGYIIKISGDTVKGYINARSDLKNARSIDFKLLPTDKEVKYEPRALKAYYLSSGKKYVSKTVAIADVSDISIQRKAFLEILEQGRAVLYYLRDSHNDSHFYIEKDTSFFELTNEQKTITNDEGISRIYYSEQYSRIIYALFKDCPAWNENSKFQFSEYGIKKAVRMYNICFNSEVVDQVKNQDIKENINVSYTVFVGVNISTVSVKPYYSYFSIMEDPNFRILPSLGFAVNLAAPGISQNFTLKMGLNYNHKGAFSQTNPNKFNFHYLDAEMLLKYTYPKGSARPFIGAGAIFGYLLNTKESAIIIKQELSNYVYSLHDKMEKYEFGYCLETGIFVPIHSQQKGFILAFRFEQTVIPIAIRNIGSLGNRVFQFKVGFRFK